MLLKPLLVFGLFLFEYGFNTCDSIRVLGPKSELSQLLRDTPGQYWGNLSFALLDYAQDQSLQVQHEWMKAVKRGNLRNVINGKCFETVEQMIRMPLEYEWSAQMIDSTGKLPSGILAGTTTELGDFDQCLSIRVDNQRWGPFSGRYCLATLALPRSKHFGDSMTHPNEWFNQWDIPLWMAPYAQKWLDNDNFYSMASGICFPSLCQPKEIRTMIMAYMPSLNHFEFNVTFCQTERELPNYHPNLYTALRILLAPWILIIPATLLELVIWYSPTQTFLGRFINCFSLISNTKILFEIKTSNSRNNEFQFIHGIRAFGSIFILIAHTGALVFVFSQMPVSVMSRHPFDMIKISKTLITQPFFNGALLVLTFFAISGLLMTYLTASSQALKINFIPYVVLRLLRLTPPLIGILCLTICVELLGSGPLWHHDILWRTLQPCYELWWVNLFYIANYYELTTTCGVQLWYLSTEFQVHIIAFIILLVYATRGSRATYLTCGAMILIGMVGVVIPVVLDYGRIPLIHHLVYTRVPNRSQDPQYVFFAIPMQLIAFFPGAIVGLMLLEKRNLKLSKIVTKFFWFLSFFFIVTIPLATYLYADNEIKLNGDKSLANVIAFVCTVFIWSLANVWIFYQCAVDPENPVARFLSANIWKPFSRMSFCLYLTHIMAIWFNAYQTRTLMSLASFQEVYKNVSIVMLYSFAFGYFIYVTFEAPPVRLLKLIIRPSNITPSVTKIPLDLNNNTILNGNHNKKMPEKDSSIELKQE